MQSCNNKQGSQLVRNTIIADGQWGKNAKVAKNHSGNREADDAKELKALVSLVALILQTDLLLLQTDIAAIFHFSSNNNMKIAKSVRHYYFI